MTDHDVTAQALRRLTSDDDQLHARTLPPAVASRMQDLVNARAHECVHVALARDLPPAAVGKLAVQGVPMVWCAANPVCTVEAFQTIAAWPGVRVDDSCSLCGRRQTVYRMAWTDESISLTMIGFVCATCTARLADLVGEVS